MPRQLVALVGYLLIFFILLFGPAGTLDWPAAWVLLAVLLIVRLTSLLALWRSRRALLDARTIVPVPQAGQPLADRILLPAYMASYAAQVAFASWDIWHLHWSAPPAPWTRGAGLLIFAIGWWVIYLALRENAFALTVVRLQTDRGQDVVDTGPYAIVRHPMYSGITLVMIGFPLWLGSIAALIAAVVPVTLLGARIHFEERLLAVRLAGYDEYKRRVRWRLMPNAW
jgi:protein-S-isoprenylcysteine O-methyltransferase Ste14